MRKAALLIALFFVLVGQGQEVMINEFMAANQQTIADEDGDYSDWIELYNPGQNDIQLDDWYLSDDSNDPLKWQISEAIIEAQSFLLVFASDKDRSGPGQLHTNFRISAAGEPLLLSNPLGDLIHLTPAIALDDDVSYGSIIDGNVQEHVLFHPASPGDSNGQGSPISNETDVLTFSHPAGFYVSGIPLGISSASGMEIRYTLDGSDPIGSSTLHTSPILINDRSGQEDVLSLIQTGIGWEEPLSRGEKATVIKAASFTQGQRRSAVYTATYFISERIDEKYKDLPVISLTMHRDSLFSDNKGIYVPGDAFIESEALSTGNYQLKGREWEREVYMEYFDAGHDKKLGHAVGARIHGKSTRSHPQKTLRLYARGEYGPSEFEEDFFPEKDIASFKRILLRTPSSDFGRTVFRDELCTELITDMEVDYMAYRPCILFINGEYWGIHNIRERIDEHYLAENHGVDPDSVDMLELNGLVEQGSASDFEEMMAYVRSHDLADTDAYAEMQRRMDMENFMDYCIAQLYFANFDWPFVNLRYWKSHRDDAQWRWIFHDCDRCMLDHEYDHLDDFIFQSEVDNAPPRSLTILFSSLLNNDAFRNDFVQRFILHLSTTFKADKVLRQIDEMERRYTPLVREHNDRWNYPGSVNFWKESIEEMRAFAIQRPAVMLQELLNYFGNQYTLYPNPVSGSQQFVNLDMEHSEEVRVRFEIYASSGQFIKRIELDSSTTVGHPQLSLSGMEPGLYFVRIHYGSLLFIERLIVE